MILVMVLAVVGAIAIGSLTSMMVLRLVGAEPGRAASWVWRSGVMLFLICCGLVLWKDIRDVWLICMAVGSLVGIFVGGWPAFSDAARLRWDAVRTAGTILGLTALVSQAVRGYRADQIPLLLYEGAEYSSMGNLDVAIGNYDRALELDPSNHVANNFRGYAVYVKWLNDSRSSRIEEALPYMRRSVKSRKNYFWGHFNLAQACLSASLWDEAFYAASESIRLADDKSKRFLVGSGKPFRMLRERSWPKREEFLSLLTNAQRAWR